MSTHERKLTLESLSNLLSKLSENSTDVYWLSSPNLMRMEYLSPRYEDLWGRSRQELYDNLNVWATYLHPDEPEKSHPIQIMVPRIAQAGEQARYQGEYRIVHPDGTVRWISDRAFPIYDEQKRCCGIMGVALDISYEKGLNFPSLEMLDDLDEIDIRPQARHTAPPLANPNQPKILLVEDDLILQKIIAKTLTEAGCEVVVVNGVNASRRVLSENVFDLVICDMSLVDGTGLDMITWVRHETNHPNQATPFVVLTSNTDPAVHQMALTKGFLEVLQKPLSKEMARSLIKRYTGVEKQQHLISDDIKDIIDIDATSQITGDESMRKEIFSMLSMLLQQDRKHLEDLYVQNDIVGTRDILHRLDGSFRYCVTPRLQRARARLHQAVRETDQLRNVKPQFEEFYQEIDQYLTTYNQLKTQGRL